LSRDWRLSIYAIIDTGGKQYRVSPNNTLEVEMLDVAEGDKIGLEKVLLIGDGEDTLIGDPIIKGAKVIATSLGQVKGDKVIVYKYKAKVRYRRKRGHRQTYTRITVNEIIKPGV
jgi:large subunit ribosomal protein L21